MFHVIRTRLSVNRSFLPLIDQILRLELRSQGRGSNELAEEILLEPEPIIDTVNIMHQWGFIARRDLSGDRSTYVLTKVADKILKPKH